MVTTFIPQKNLMALLLSTLVGLSTVGCKQASDGLTETKPVTPVNNTGGNTDTGGNTNTGGTDVVNELVPYLSLLQEKNTLNSGGDTATFTVETTDASGGVLAGVPIQMNIKTPTTVGATFSTASEIVTSTDGFASSSIKFNPSTLDHKLNHDVLVTVNALNTDKTKVLATKTLTFSVTGSIVNLSSSTTTVEANSNIKYDIEVADSLNKPLANATVSLFDNNANAAVSGATAITNSQGKASISVAANALKAVNNEVAVSATAKSTNTTYTNASSEFVVNISNEKLLFAPTAAVEQPINSQLTIPVLVKGATAAEVNGKIVNMTSTLGTLNSSSKTASGASLVNGVYQATVNFTLTSPSPGTAKLNISMTSDAKSVTVSKEQTFISTKAALFAINTSAAVLNKGETSKVVVVVKDANNAPTKNVNVVFNKTNDPSAGSLSAATAVTDAAGEAYIYYTAGQSSTPPKEVVITANLADFSGLGTKTTYLTVSSKSVQIEIGRSDKLSTASNNIYYDQAISARVLDNTGRPVANNQIVLRTEASKYKMGFFSLINQGSLLAFWSQDITTTCVTEDTNQNGFLDNGEDTNENGKVDIANPAAILLENGVTNSNGVISALSDANGEVNFKLRYLKQNAQWATFNLYASTIVEGTEGKASLLNAGLPVLIDDVSSATDSNPIRPNLVSPFGASSSCGPL